MQNLKYRIDGTKLLIEIDLSTQGTETGRGNVMVASTGNWAKIPELGKGWSMNMVVVRKQDSAVPRLGPVAVSR